MSHRIKDTDILKYANVVLDKIPIVLKLIKSKYGYSMFKNNNIRDLYEKFCDFICRYGYKMKEKNRFISAELFISFYSCYFNKNYCGDLSLKYPDKFEFLNKIIDSNLSIGMPFFILDIEEYASENNKKNSIFIYTLSFFLKVMSTFDDMIYDVEKVVSERIWNSEVIDDIELFVRRYINSLYLYKRIPEYKEFIQLFIKILYDEYKTNRFLIFSRCCWDITAIICDEYICNYLYPTQHEKKYMLDIYNLLSVILKCIDENTLDKDIEKNIWNYMYKFICTCKKEHLDHYEDLLEQLLKGNKTILTLMEGVKA